MARSPEVDAWFARLDHPLKPMMMRVREALLAGDPRLDECIKWQCPTFIYGGNLASINPIAKSHVSLLFHTGALIPGRHGHLEGGEKTARYMKFADLDEVEAKRPALAALARVWCDWKSRAARAAPGKTGGRRTTTKPASRRKPGAKMAAARKAVKAKPPKGKAAAKGRAPAAKGHAPAAKGHAPAAKGHARTSKSAKTKPRPAKTR